MAGPGSGGGELVSGEPEAGAAAKPANALQRLRARLAARPDTEHEQGILRLIISSLVFLYLLPDALTKHNTLPLYVMGIHLVLALAIFLRIAYSTSVSPARRVFAQFADVAAITWYMTVFGESAAPLFLLYIWVTLGSGFRFGPRYLVSELAMSVGGFGIALYFNDFWRAHTALGVGLLLGMFAVSLYVLSLVRRMFDALARAEAANLAKRRFISMVSHELRTPLNAIIGMADLLRDTPLSREQADMLQTLRGSSRVMLGLVEDVLDFSKIEAGKVVMEKIDFDLHALVNSTCRIVSAQAAAKGVDFVVSIMPEVPPALRGDPHHLRQVLINLAGNAAKFTEKGSVTVHVSVQAETEAMVRLKFSIRDTGVGIAPEAQSKIFESFAQADESTTRRFGGTGLGTTIAKQLVGLMGGRIGLESALGLGSTFWVEVDFDKQPERTAAGGEAIPELGEARILLVGFPPGERRAVEEALASWGATAVAAATVDEGVARLVSEISLARPYHSALLYAAHEDAQLAQRFRRAAPNPAPPAILAAPRAADVRRFEMLSSGFAAVLELPFDKRRLFNVLHSVAAGDEPREGVVRLQDYARRASVATPLRILVADDNPTNREVIGRILERGGHAVTLVNDGEQALDAFERDAPNLVILDRNMPGMSGLEALQALRLMTRGRERVPVIMLSADVTTDAKREALESGADAFLPKPVETLRLLDEIQSLAAANAASGRRAEAPTSLHVVPAPAAAPAVVNAETLRHLEELGTSLAFVEKLVGVFVADAASMLVRIEQVLAGRNFHEFRSLLHAMKGSSASMGTDRLTRLCDRLAALSDSELRLQAASLQRTLAQEMGEARMHLERHIVERRKAVG
ncbi:MAG TPA: response regulator [Burkholderiales bacterium]|jgi:two-component system sensor histidine kinase RpfC